MCNRLDKLVLNHILSASLLQEQGSAPVHADASGDFLQQYNLISVISYHFLIHLLLVSVTFLNL